MSRANFDAGGNARLTALGRTAYLQAMDEGWADYRRLHAESRRSRQFYDAARETIAGVLHTRTDNIHFAPSSTAAFHSAIGALFAGRSRIGSTAVASKIERSAVLNALRFYGEERLIDVDREGTIDLEAFAHEVRSPGVAFAAVQHANHEVATIQDLDAISEYATSAGVPLLVDATSTIGHIAPPKAPWDVLVAQPADWGGGQGAGVLAVKPRTRVRFAWPEDQDGWFPGGVSLPAAFAAAVTLSEAENLRVERAKREFEWVDRIRSAAAQIPQTMVVGSPDNRLPYLSTFSFLYVDGEAITTELDRFGFAVGSGSACTTATLEPSHVLAAMGVLTQGNVRVALDSDVTESDVRRFIAVLPQAVSNVRRNLGVDFL